MRTEYSSRYAVAISRDAPIVFVHGSLSSSRIWEPYAAAFSARKSIAIDLPGYGDEPAWPADAEYRLRDAASSIRRTLKGRSEPVDMVAHSFGGAVALRYALDNPISVRTLTLIEPSWFGVLRDLGPKARPALKAIKGIAGGCEELATADGRLFAMGRFVDYWTVAVSGASFRGTARRCLPSSPTRYGGTSRQSSQSGCGSPLSDISLCRP